MLSTTLNNTILQKQQKTDRIGFLIIENPTRKKAFLLKKTYLLDFNSSWELSC